MRKKGFGIPALCLALLAAGCAAREKPVGPSFEDSRPTGKRPDAAVVYVVRYYAEPPNLHATILVNGKEVVDLSQRGFTWFYLPPGRHEIRAEWLITEQTPAQIGLEVVGGSTYYLDLVGTSRVTGNGIIRGSQFQVLAPYDGEARASRCGFQKPGSSTPAS